MKEVTKTRSQRRMEKKQALILLVLVLAVSLASFVLGVVIGRQGAERDLVQKQQAAEKIFVAQVPAQQTVPAQTGNKEQVTENGSAAAPAEPAEQASKLTFYDNLAKEETVPLGSGINLPPEPKDTAKPKVQPPIDLPDQPIVKKEKPAIVVAKVETAPPVDTLADAPLIMPKSDPQGHFSVQVGSFSSAEDAGAFKQKLITKGYSAFVVEADLGAKGLWYRVRLGPYSDGAAAKTVLQLAEKKEQIKGFISRQ